MKYARIRLNETDTMFLNLYRVDRVTISGLEMIVTYPDKVDTYTFNDVKDVQFAFNSLKHVTQVTNYGFKN